MRMFELFPKNHTFNLIGFVYKMAAEETKQKFICLHYGNYKLAWDSIIMLATLYVAVLVPYQAAFTDYRACKGEFHEFEDANAEHSNKENNSSSNNNTNVYL